ncbi:MAG: hypothetical protein L6R35_001536 [Caloplaca aegaea]|nr:MAG: hypothetical protein L6R35_001536 [Caloplaca aegaea]
MAQRAQVHDLAKELISCFPILGSTNESGNSNSLRDHILQTLLDPEPGTTNPFEISARFEGLEEKFSVLNNDELANALRERLDHLSTCANRWTPEILSLLLNLSDHPLEKTKVDALDRLSVAPESPSLTWSDIFAADPPDNHDGLWDDVDFARDGSDEDADSIVRVSPTFQDALMTNNEEDGPARDLHDLFLPADEDGLYDVLKAQFWEQTIPGPTDPNSSDNFYKQATIILTESQVIREVDFVLRGLPSTIFKQHLDRTLDVFPRYQLKHVSPTKVSELSRGWSVIAAELARLREWKNQGQQYPLLQTFEAIMAEKLTAVEHTLTQIRLQCLTSQGGSTASLLCYDDMVQNATRSIRQLASILGDLHPKEDPPIPFGILELLYDRVCTGHTIGDTDALNYVIGVFFRCLQTYLKPLKSWMAHGELSKFDQGIFIQDGEPNVSLTEVWSRRHLLVLDDSGQLYAPRFLRLAAKSILNTGKSVHFLRLLGHSQPESDAEEQWTAHFDSKQICVDISANPLYSFPERFDKALNEWIVSSYHSSSAMLRQQLDMRCGLVEVLDALEYVYLFRNGALSGEIVSVIAARLDRGNVDWSDEFILTDLLRSVFAVVSCVDNESLTVRTSGASICGTSSQQRSVNNLHSIHVKYLLPWPIANIVNKSAMRTYQRVFILLLQLQRAKQALERRFPRDLMKQLMKDPVDVSAIALRHRMLSFVNIVFSYMVDVVLSVASFDMRRKIAESRDLDELIETHQAYIARLNEQCLLSQDRAQVMQAITSVLDLVILLTGECTRYGSHVISRVGAQSMRAHLKDQRPLSRRFQGADVSDHDDNDSEVGLDRPPGSSITRSAALPSLKLKNMHDTFQQLLGFISVSLRSASKGGNAQGVEILTDMLAVGGLGYG